MRLKLEIAGQTPPPPPLVLCMACPLSRVTVDQATVTVEALDSVRIGQVTLAHRPHSNA